MLFLRKINVTWPPSLANFASKFLRGARQINRRNLAGNTTISNYESREREMLFYRRMLERRTSTRVGLLPSKQKNRHGKLQATDRMNSCFWNNDGILQRRAKHLLHIINLKEEQFWFERTTPISFGRLTVKEKNRCIHDLSSQLRLWAISRVKSYFWNKKQERSFKEEGNA